MQSSLRVVQKFLASDVRDQVGTGTLIIGLQLHNEGNNDTLDSSDLFSIEQPSDADPNITDTAIYFDESVLKGINKKCSILPVTANNSYCLFIEYPYC